MPLTRRFIVERTRILRAAGASLVLCAATAGAVVVAGADARAQSSAAGPVFEVAAVRRNTSSSPAGAGSRMQPGGNYTATNLTLQRLIAIAYDVPTDRVLDGPDWLDDDRYDIAARAGGNPGAADVAPLVRTLLRDRFGLGVREEMREYPVYALVKARDDGTLGPRLWPSETDCAGGRSLSGVPADLSARPVCRAPLIVEKDVGMFVAGNVPLSMLAQVLTFAAGRPVVDQTGASGRFDISLEWASRPDVDGVQIFTAVQEQLGLRLQSTTAPLPVVVVLAAQRPAEN